MIEIIARPINDGTGRRVDCDIVLNQSVTLQPAD